MTFNIGQFFSSPAGDVTLTVLVMAVGAAVKAYFAANADAKRKAQITADVIAYIEPKVAALESVTNLPGADKADQVLKAAGKFLDDQGVKGDARAAIDQDLPELLEATLAKVRAAAQSTTAK